MRETKLAIGIDFGTTNSCAALVQSRQARVIPNAEGQNTTPSIVGLLDDGEKVVGVAAKRQAVANPRRTISSIKRFMGRMMDEVPDEQAIVPYEIRAGTNNAVRVLIDGEERAPEEIAALILAKLKTDIEEYVGRPVEDAVVTVPAYFNDAQRQAVKDAAQVAGLNVTRLINEPTAAALAYGYDGRLDAGRVLVFDLGGGTFDVSVLEIRDSVFDVLATSGDNHLGGDNFDKTIVDWLLAEFKKESGIDLAQDPMALQRLYEAAEKAKIELSSAPTTEIHLPFLAADPEGPHHLQTQLNRAQLQKLIGPLLERLTAPIERCLDAAGIKREELDDVILVGGMTRMPAVQERVSELLAREPHRGINPDEAVALGAAIQASVLLGDEKDVVLLDVTPLSLGLEVTEGSTEKLIPANTRVPCRESQIFTTGFDNQTSVEVRVVQGERELARDNRLIGRVQLLDIPPQPRGQPDIEVIFELNTNGILEVSARDIKTGVNQKVKIESVTGLSSQEVSRMHAEASRFVEADRRARALATIRNEVETLEDQVGLLISDPTSTLSNAAKDRVHKALSRMRDSIDVAASPEEMGAIRSQLVDLAATISRELGMK